jgi:bacillolysin
MVIIKINEESSMKKITSTAAVFLFAFSALFGAHVGQTFVKPLDGSEENVFKVPAMPFPFGLFSGTLGEVFYFSAEIGRGNLRLLRVQDDPLAAMEHRRYQQYFSGLEVFGGEIIQHFKNNSLQGIDGEYYLITEMELKPGLTKEQAADFFRRHLNDLELKERADETRLQIFPITDGEYRLVYRVVLERDMDYSMTGFIDARSGEILSLYSNIKTATLTIGTGLGVHGEKLKLSTNYENGKYWLMDKGQNRPVNQYTFYIQNNVVLTDTDNYWDLDKASNCVHAYMGLTYNYYYQVLNRHGIDGNNLDTKAVVHYPIGKDNAFWNPDYKMMFFLDPGAQNWQTAAALDVIAHEFSHGVTEYTSGLIYQFQSGALNEAFSDIMGTAVEFKWQPAGAGFLKADWYMGEDIFSNYGYCLRNLADPNSQSSSYGLYPCHLNQYINLPGSSDYGGVHINCTIYAHAYYLLANGGTNKISNIAVAGIGVEKATKIFYSAFTSYLTQRSQFVDAANAILKSASTLFGSTSNESQQTIKAMQAIGWTVN